MGETTFENAKVGDKVWSVRKGWGKVVDVDTSETYSVKVEFAKIWPMLSYTIDGKYSKTDMYRELFWNEVKFEIPERPKRKVMVTKWLNVYRDGKCYITYTDELYDDKDTADSVGQTGNPKAIAAVPVTFEDWED